MSLIDRLGASEQAVRAKYPVLIGDLMKGHDGIIGGEDFPFRSWAAANAFHYPEWATDFMGGCGSAAEAFFVRAFLQRKDCHIEGNHAVCGETRVQLQVRARSYKVDMVITRRRAGLAVEVDGWKTHYEDEEKVAADYLRQRRVMLTLRLPLIRFMALDAFRHPEECWRQIDALLKSFGARD